MSHAWLPAEPQPPKDEVDWDAWLGPCPWRPYNSAYIRGGWRGHYDFHTSCIGEWGAHTFAQSQAGIDALNTSAVEYHYVNNPTGDGMVTRFANGVQMILQREGWHGSCGMRFEGTEGWVGDRRRLPQARGLLALAAGRRRQARRRVHRADQRPMNHVRNFFDCVKSRKPTVANPDVMHHSMSTVHAANICMWLKRDMVYDPVKRGVPQRRRSQPPAQPGPAGTLDHLKLNPRRNSSHVQELHCISHRSPRRCWSAVSPRAHAQKPAGIAPRTRRPS